MAHYSLDLERGGRLVADVRQTPGQTEVSLVLEGTHEPCVLRWGVGRGPRRWLVPPQSEWPAGSRAANHAAVDTPFPESEADRRLTIAFGASPEYAALDFVLFFPAGNRWDNNRGRDYQVSLAGDGVPAGRGERAEAQDALSRSIIEGETGPHSWTLMHRFNLCYDLLDRIPGGDSDGLALIFVWLRFSAIRQLDWQRNYNTKPRELAHAQDRLTLKLAERFAVRADERPWLRLIITTLGRGGEGQRVRDEVLNIMHRHHITEVSGHFMEEWHQKLHNNTTPDDIVICDAYLAFLRSDGNRDVFRRTLEEGGVTRARLQGYERPIRSDPDFIPWLKDALIHDFEAFRHVLNRLHSGTDLAAAIEEARPSLDATLAGEVDWIWLHQGDAAAALDALAEHITEARRLVAGHLGSAQSAGTVRALVYLDLALEDLLRLAIERQLHLQLGIGRIGALIALTLQNASFVSRDAELRLCGRYWERVQTAGSTDDQLWALRADAGVERIARVVARWLDRYQQALQPKAEMLGRAFGADLWAIASFSEEVIRGRAAAMVPVLARLLRHDLRHDRRLPSWQIVSGGRAHGEMVTVPALESIQAARFSRPTVVLTDTVSGMEEMPVGVTAVLTSQDVDVLAHVAIRARNAGVLFATCQDADQIERLKGLAGRDVAVEVGSTGDVVVRPSAHDEPLRAEPHSGRAAGKGRIVASTPPAGTPYVLPSGEFTTATVGSKARTLARLEGKLPAWIHLPQSVAIPFGAFERTLDDRVNSDPARHYRELAGRLAQVPAQDATARRQLLDALRQVVATLAVPSDLLATLRPTLEQAGLGWPDPERAWSCIKQVWASKWNERAFLSREANGVDHDAVMMSVLIQPVIEAEYAFVIHTANPATGARDEIHAEMVIGLGETLVANDPGRAFSFRRSKQDERAEVIAFPSKSHGLSAGGLIFRSDSNAEDLLEYAGAGLYDSVTLVATRASLLDYTEERLVWDDQFRREMMRTVAETGMAVEAALGVAQDVEGAYAQDTWYVLQARPQVGLRGA
jgi:alpha-glucan,water dikinase